MEELNNGLGRTFLKQTVASSVRHRELSNGLTCMTAGASAPADEIWPVEVDSQRNLQVPYQVNENTHRLQTNFPGCASSMAFE